MCDTIHAEVLQDFRSNADQNRIPNWIGPVGCTIEQARFVPISADKLPDAMSVWERYMHEDARLRSARCL